MNRKTENKTPVYHSYLLRLWRESKWSAWRASLENATTGERRGFANLASLVAFLQDKYQEDAVPPQENPVDPQA